MSKLSRNLLHVVVVFIVLLAGGCSGHKGSVKGNQRPDREITIHPGNIDGTRRQIIDEAMTWLGTPYKYAGMEKGEGTDCSGMVVRVFEDVAGWKLPRNSAKQAEFCDPLDSDEVEPGDLVFFATGKDSETVSHVGIMLDNENFIHASASKGVVVSKVTSSYYLRTFMMYGRIPKKIRSRSVDLSKHKS